MKTSLAIVTIVAALGLPAWAGTVKLPKAESLATITFPEDGWTVTAEDESVEAESKDEEVYIYVEVIDADSVEAALKESVAYLEKEKVKVKEDTVKQKEGTVNGIPVVDFTFEGSDKDGPTIVSLTILVLSKEKCLSSMYWASPEGEKKHDKELTEIFKSIKKAK